MKHNPLVSVVIPFLNTERFLQEAIESVFAQAYENWELLLVDDGSSDGSTEVARRYAEAYAGKVRYLEHPGHQNRGQSASRNLGIRNSAGEYVAFLDADDVWLPDKLQQQVRIFETHPDARMVYGPALFWNSWRGRFEHAKGDFLQRLGVRGDVMYSPGFLLGNFVRDEGVTPCPSGLVVGRDVIERTGGFEEWFRGPHEDQLFCVKAALKVPVFVSSKCWFKYRRHPDSVCSTSVRQRTHRSSRKAYLTWLNEYLVEEKVDDPEIRQVLDAELWPYRYPMLAALRRWPARLVTGLRHYAGAGLRRSLPRPVRRSGRRVMNVLKVARARARLGLGLQPLSQRWGHDRGKPVHRYYLERFLTEHAADIHGHCLEFQEDSYATRFGGTAVTKVEILHVDDSNPRATVVADLTQPNDIPSDHFDCIICTHVLHMILELEKAVSEVYRILKPGGVLLVAVPHISMCDPRYGEIWRFTPEGLQVVLAGIFGGGNVTTYAYGNSLTAAGEIRGVVAHEFTESELTFQDPRFAVEVCARACKPGK